MTRDKSFKRRVRERMARTGERYVAARRHLIAGSAAERGGTTAPSDGTPPATFRPGVHPATSAFRTLLAHAGHGVSETALLAAGGGVGIGVFAFHYDEFSSLFLAGRHLWHDDLAFVQGLAERLGTTLEVRETGGRAKAQRDLLELLEHGPVLAFVELAVLGHRGVTEAYYVVTVHDADPERGTARIGDLAPAPIEVPLAALAEARARHRKFANRLVRVAGTPAALPLDEAVRVGLRACIGAFERPAMRGSNFRLDGLDVLARRMRGDGKESWARTFPPGPRLWTALTSFYEYVELYGTGGGLLRPLFADALREAEARLDLELSAAADAYDVAGEAWSAAAWAALPQGVAAFDAARARIDARYAAFDEERADGRSADAGSSAEADGREAAPAGPPAGAGEPFPLDDDEARSLVEDLAGHVEEVARLEREALAALRGVPL